MRLKLFLFVVFQSCFPAFKADLKFYEEKELHIPRSLTNKQLSKVASYYNESYFKEALANIMVPRVVGTPSHEKVKEYIEKELKSVGWEVEEDTFIGNTPILGPLKFTNVVGRLNGNASRYLTLACHYDSKYFPNQNFVAATDSAVPCAMLLHLAKELHENLSFARSTDLSLMFIFFDGEEAFHQWSENDSLYGARNLALKWSKSPFPNENSYSVELDRIDVLVLLDLLGAKNPLFYSYFQNTARWHSLLVNIERRLKTTGVVPQSQPHQFLEKSTFSGIEDDHIPFLRRNVPILHVIPSPFPKVWHTMADDVTALDFPTIRTTSTILHVFVLSYLRGETQTHL